MRWILLSCVASAVLAGCADAQPYISQARLERGLVIVLPGIEGRGSLNEEICAGLNDGGVNWAIDLSDWTSPLGFLYNLRSEDLHRKKVAELVCRVKLYRIGYPGRPVVLVGQSGGGAMAVWVAESLSDGDQVDGVILLAASMSPRYALSRALTNTCRGMVNFYSGRDWILLGLGTALYGTMDGKHTSSAGRMGFEAPAAGGSPAYQKLFQIPWQPQMAEAGNSGAHLTSGARKFVAVFVAPFVLEDNWSEKFVARVVDEEQAKPTAQPEPATQPKPVAQI